MFKITLDYKLRWRKWHGQLILKSNSEGNFGCLERSEHVQKVKDSHLKPTALGKNNFKMKESLKSKVQTKLAKIVFAE